MGTVLMAWRPFHTEGDWIRKSDMRGTCQVVLNLMAQMVGFCYPLPSSIISHAKIKEYFLLYQNSKCKQFQVQINIF